MTKNFSGSDLRELCRQASVFRLRDLARESNLNSDDEGYISKFSYGHCLTVHFYNWQIQYIAAIKYVRLSKVDGQN